MLGKFQHNSRKLLNNCIFKNTSHGSRLFYFTGLQKNVIQGQARVFSDFGKHKKAATPIVEIPTITDSFSFASHPLQLELKSLKTLLSKIEKEIYNIEFVINLIPKNEIYETESLISKCTNNKQKIFMSSFSKIELQRKVVLLENQITSIQQQITYVQQRIALQKQERLLLLQKEVKNSLGKNEKNF